MDEITILLYELEKAKSEYSMYRTDAAVQKMIELQNKIDNLQKVS